jgi:CheY-like chemotaxis protein
MELTMMETTRVRCSRCTKTFDGMTAEWCRCVTRMVSPVCPACHFCMCKEPPFAVSAFWRSVGPELRARREAEVARRAASAARGAGRATVLIVDDDEEIRAIAAYAVGEMGFRVTTAACAEEALAIVLDAPPDVVLTDALMPRIDGRELCLRIKQISPRTKVVVMTSLYKSSRYASEARRVFRADDYIAKPIDFAHLQKILTRVAEEAA